MAGLIPSLDPVVDMKVTGSGIEQALAAKQGLEERLRKLELHGKEDRPSRVAAYAKKMELMDKAKVLRKVKKKKKR